MDVFDSAQFIPDTRPPDDQYLVNTPVDGTTKRYEFAGLRQIGLNNFSRASTAGNQRCTRARCGITGVRIHIFPQLKERLSSEVVDENLYLRNPITRNIPWAVR